MCDCNVAACLLTSRQKNLSFAHYLWKNVIYYKDAAQWGWISPAGISSFFLQRLSDISCTLSSDWSEETHPVVSNRFQGFIFLLCGFSNTLRLRMRAAGFTRVHKDNRSQCWMNFSSQRKNGRIAGSWLVDRTSRSSSDELGRGSLSSCV